MGEVQRQPQALSGWFKFLLTVVVLASLSTCAVLVIAKALGPSFPAGTTPLLRSDPAEHDPLQPPLQLAAGRHLTVWWDNLPASVLSRTIQSGAQSNVRPADYVGPETCKECHAKNYGAWSSHPHRSMNALASESTVKGDFSGKSPLTYRGGLATFERRADMYVMHLERGEEKRTYRITQTIGSRFYQYYVGTLIEGPEPADHHFYRKDHVLPLGYWLPEKAWIPIVHIGPERPDADRPDPYHPPDRGRHYAEYASACNQCHTTFPLGDLFGRRPQQIGEYAPLNLNWSLRDHLEETHPEMLREMAGNLRWGAAKGDVRGEEATQNPMTGWDAEHHAATFGVSCEACHLGCREHVASGGKILPRFFPTSPHLSVDAKKEDLDYGRTHDNINWACGRCHVGRRPAFAAGMSTWNSVEYSDAMRGACYSRLTCIHCHSPHEALGEKWSPTAEQDDAVCLKCHDKFEPASARQAHTHHPAGGDGARCMNCHMPRINEGLQDVVRTHMIYSPTRADMIEANHPNACNLCHTDRTIDWTLDSLKAWYGKTYDEARIAANYPQRPQPAARGWLHSDNESVRLVAVDALTRARDAQALPDLLGALDDPLLLNRQFAMRELRERFGVRSSDFGYRFYMASEERKKPVEEIRARWARER